MKLTLNQIIEFEEVSRILTDQGRWTTTHELIFKHDNEKFYRVNFLCGSTEEQDGTDWNEELDCVEVHRVPKTVMVWEKVSA